MKTSTSATIILCAVIVCLTAMVLTGHSEDAAASLCVLVLLGWFYLSLSNP